MSVGGATGLIGSAGFVFVRLFGAGVEAGSEGSCGSGSTIMSTWKWARFMIVNSSPIVLG